MQVEGRGFRVVGKVVVAGGIGTRWAVEDGGRVEGRSVGKTGEVVKGFLVRGGDAGCVEEGCDGADGDRG